MGRIDYRQLQIKEFPLWNLQLHDSQYPYIGRCYAWCKRQDAVKLEDMRIDERNELFDLIVPRWEKAVKELFNSTWTNIASYGNTSKHLHWHLIPRYDSSRTFYGLVFDDVNQSKNYSPYEKKNIDESILFKIRNDITEKINL